MTLGALEDITQFSADLDFPQGCGCAACQNGQTNYFLGGEGTVENILTGDPVHSEINGNATNIIHGNEWGPGGGVGLNVTFSFPTSVPSYYAGNAQERNSFQEFTASMKNAARDIFDMLETFTNLTFTETTGTGDITLAQAWLTSGSSDPGAWAYYPDQGSYSGDVWTNIKYASSTQTVTTGSYGFYTLLHEIGHGLGLVHTFEAGLTGAENTEQYSVMAYDWSTWGSTFAESYMLYDIYSLQTIYGANTGYNSGNTTYTLRSGDAYSIWDGGGTDTLDGSAITTAMTIRLTDGSFSSVGQTNNITIAYNAVIENATGGSGNDIFYGNAVANVLLGGNGNDTFNTDAGNDTLDGQGGTDTVVYSYAISAFLLTLINATTVSIQHIAGALGTDTVSNMESYNFNGTVYTHAEIQTLAQGLDQYVVGFRWSGTTKYVNSGALGTSTVTASSIGYNGATGTIATYDRTINGLTITINSAQAPGRILVNGKDGNDTFAIAGTHAGLEIVFKGGAGDDTLTIANTITGNDTINGGAGNDSLHGGNGTDYLYGEDGNDTLYGDDGNDVLYGGAGVDTLYGGNGNDYLYANDGGGTLDGGAGADQLTGGTGADIMNGGTESDKILGYEGNDTIDAGDGDDTAQGGSGADTINGGNGVDTLYGDDGDDIINGGAGGDVINGGNDNDTISGGDGIDKLYGGAGGDSLDGGNQDDTLNGNAGNDELNGGAGNDTLYGEDGLDVLIGGGGTDWLYGGNGADVFGFAPTENAFDHIMDFNASEDVINITDLLSGYTHGVSDIDDFVQIAHLSGQFRIRIDANGGGDSFVLAARVYTDLPDNTTAQNMLDSGMLIANQTLLG